MSTQELISIMGYVDNENNVDFQKELESRIEVMNEEEKRAYQKNLTKEKKE